MQVFGEKAFEIFGKGFISMHFSDQHPGMHNKVLLFKFTLPDVNNMADMSHLVALIPCWIDLVGRYKLSPQASQLTQFFIINRGGCVRKIELIFVENVTSLFSELCDTYVQARYKSEAATTKAAQEAYKELQSARQEALQKRKAERRKMMEEAEAKLSAEALRKKEVKERTRQLKKAMPRMKMTRGH